MNNHDIYQIGACSLGNIISDDYTYRPYDEENNEPMEQHLYPDVYGRKRRNGYYDWETDDEA